MKLGGFHFALNFLNAVGQHFADAGLWDVLNESRMYNECRAKAILEGKSLSKAVRAHKMMQEAHWHILWEKFYIWRTDNYGSEPTWQTNALKKLREALADDNHIAIQENLEFPYMRQALQELELLYC